MKKKFLIYSLALGLAFSYGCGDNKPKQETDTVEAAQEQNEEKVEDVPKENKAEKDAEFMVEAASGGLMEVHLAQMAIKQAASKDVKALAQMILEDHQKANAELKALAAQKNVTLPETMGEENQKMHEELTGLKGAEFDKKYLNMMVEDHEDDTRKFKEMSEDAQDPALKEFALKTLPTLDKHLVKSKELKDKIK